MNAQEVAIDEQNKKVSFNGEDYRIIFTTNQQLGDDSCFDRGIRVFILFDKEEQKHYSLSSRYYTYIDEDTGDYAAEYEEWSLNQLD